MKQFSKRSFYLDAAIGGEPCRARAEIFSCIIGKELSDGIQAFKLNNRMLLEREPLPDLFLNRVESPYGILTPKFMEKSFVLGKRDSGLWKEGN